MSKPGLNHRLSSDRRSRLFARTFVLTTANEIRTENQGKYLRRLSYLRLLIQHFTNKLQTDIYTEWRDYYLDYNKLKKSLKEGINNGPWTQEREQLFIEELEGQLEKIQSFQATKVGRTPDVGTHSLTR